MASRKIIFFIIIGIVLVGAIFGLLKLSNSKDKEKAETVSSISLWLVGGSTEEYQKIFDGARAYIPEIENAIFDIRVFPNYEGYRDVLLSTLASGGGPDIFMIEAGSDDVLSNKSVSIPEDFIDLTDYEKRYEDIFLDLLETIGEGKDISRSLKGVPLGYETLGVFYHKSLFPVVPKTWNEVDALYSSDGTAGFFPVNIGMGPSYTPFATDIISLFLLNNEVTETKAIQGGGGALTDYMSYAVTPIGNDTDSDGKSPIPVTLASEKNNLDDTGLSTIDLFIRGRVGMVIGYPSLIRDIEKALKRAGGEVLDDLILTERIPALSVGETRNNIARYNYLVISQNSKNAVASARLLSYLMSTEALEKIREVFPYLISPDRTIMVTQGVTPLSSVYARTRLGPFLPVPGEKLTVYRYGLKSEYEKIFRDYIDRGGKIDISSLLTRLQKNIECKIESSTTLTLSTKCLEE